MANVQQLLSLLVVIFCSKTISALPTCIYGGDATVKCKTPTNTDTRLVLNCPMGQLPTKDHLLSEPMPGNTKQKQYYWVCNPIEQCSPKSSTSCRTALAKDANDIKPPSFQNQAFQQMAGNQLYTTTKRRKQMYYRIYQHLTCTSTSEARPGVKEGEISCDDAGFNDAFCVSNCVDVKSKNPSECSSYQRADMMYGMIHDAVKGCGCYMCGHKKTMEKSIAAGRKQCDIAPATEPCVTNCDDRLKVKKCEHYDGNRELVVGALLYDMERKCFYYECSQRKKKTVKGNWKECDEATDDDPCVTNCDSSQNVKKCKDYDGNRDLLSPLLYDRASACHYYQCGTKEKRGDVSGLNGYGNWVLVGLGVASLSICYACFCVVIGASLGYWVGRNVKQPIFEYNI